MNDAEGAAAPHPGPEAPARLALLPPGSGPRLVDGAWWPRSYDLGRELPGLLTALEKRWPRITRVTVDRSTWRARSGVLVLGDRELHISGSESGPGTHTICLLSYGVGRCDLLVIPPATPPDEAHRLMGAAPADHEANA
jgi:hypothetical protein